MTRSRRAPVTPNAESVALLSTGAAVRVALIYSYGLGWRDWWLGGIVGVVDGRDEELYRKHADELIRFATTLVGAASAEDVFSAAILKAMTSPSWRSVSEHRAYLFRAVLNEALGIKRSDRRRSVRETTVAPHEDVETAHVSLEVADAMSQLSVRQRSVLFLAYWLDLTVEEIASTLLLSRRSTERALTTARNQLEEQLR